MSKPSLDLAFGPAPKGAPADDVDDDAEPVDAPDDEATEGLQTACNEFLDACGFDVPDDKRAAACDALKQFVSMAK